MSGFRLLGWSPSSCNASPQGNHMDAEPRQWFTETLSTAYYSPYLLADRTPPRASQLTPTVRWFVLYSRLLLRLSYLLLHRTCLFLLSMGYPNPSPRVLAYPPTCHSLRGTLCSMGMQTQSPHSCYLLGEGRTGLAQDTGCLSPSSRVTYQQDHSSEQCRVPDR